MTSRPVIPDWKNGWFFEPRGVQSVKVGKEPSNLLQQTNEKKAVSCVATLADVTPVSAHSFVGLMEKQKLRSVSSKQLSCSSQKRQTIVII